MILVTGGTGFIGSALVARLSSDYPGGVRASVRSGLSMPARTNVDHLVLGDLSAKSDWTRAFRGVDAVVHTAARVHVMRDAAVDPLADFRRVNVQGTADIARQAALAGVRRFIFISSIKVNGEHTLPGHAYTAADAPAPMDPYGISKHEAEESLRLLARQTGMEVVIIRPVLVYGRGVKGNFRTVLHWLAKGIPLPLGAIDNRRSLVALDNLVDAIATCLRHPAAANQTFLVSDGEDLSTTMLLRRIGTALGRPTRLIAVPSTVLVTAAALLGKEAVARRLVESLQVDITKTIELLGWSPPIDVAEGLRRTVAPE